MGACRVTDPKDDPKKAFEKFEDLLRRLLSQPKPKLPPKDKKDDRT